MKYVLKNKCSKKSLHIALLVGLVLFIALLGGFLYKTGFFEIATSIDDIRDYIERFSPYSYGLFFMIQLLSVVVAPIPSNVTSLAGAAVFGTLASFLLTFGAVVLGGAIVFALAQMLGRPFVERFVSRRDIDKYLDLIHRKETAFFAMAFLFPGFPDDILCFLAGLTDISFKRFMVLVALCRPWGLLFSCFIGGNAVELPPLALAAVGVVGLLIFIIVMKYGDRWETMLLKKFEEKKQQASHK